LSCSTKSKNIWKISLIFIRILFNLGCTFTSIKSQCWSNWINQRNMCGYCMVTRGKIFLFIEIIRIVLLRLVIRSIRFDNATSWYLHILECWHRLVNKIQFVSSTSHDFFVNIFFFCVCVYSIHSLSLSFFCLYILCIVTISKLILTCRRSFLSSVCYCIELKYVFIIYIYTHRYEHEKE
jgi:hypothetical protein